MRKNIYMGYFILREDFIPFITLEDLDRITVNEDSVWQNSLISSIESIRTKIGNRYDADLVFRPIETYVNANSYALGDRVSDAGTLYYAIQAVPALTSIGDTNYWTQGDSRNGMIKQCVIDTILFTIYGRLNGTDVPAFILRRMERSEEYMKRAQDGSDDVNLPLIPENVDGTENGADEILVATSNVYTDKYNSI